LGLQYSLLGGSMGQITGVTGLETTQDERTMATLAHALSLLGFLAPLIIFLVKRQSRFVSFHALQALLWHVAYFVLIFVLLMAWIVVMFATIAHTATTKGAQPPVGIFFVFPLLWLGIMGGWLVTAVVAIVYCIKAGQGEWADYPIFGQLARRLLKMGPRGAGIR
jgi:uncharacterized Tic20 family protein